MSKQAQQEQTHELSGKYCIEGTIKNEIGTTYGFKAARIRKDPNGAPSRGFIPCVIQVLLNQAAYNDLIQSMQDGGDAELEPAKPELVGATK